jgi:hypothetical protein
MGGKMHSGSERMILYTGGDNEVSLKLIAGLTIRGTRYMSP